MNPVIRRATNADYEPTMRLLNRVFFKSDPVGFQNFLPNLYGDPSIAMREAYLAEVDGRMVGHVGVYPLQLKTCGDAVFHAGGVGAVATDPDLRGHGVMSQLMQAAVEGMSNNNYDLSILWGDRFRYAHFGYESVGSQLEWRFDDRTAQRAGVGTAELAGYCPALHAETYLALWNADESGTVHSADSLGGVLARRGWRTAACGDGKRLAFATYGVRDQSIYVEKLCGHDDTLVPLLRGLRATVDPTKGQIWVRHGASHTSLSKLANQFSGEMLCRPIGQVRAICLENLCQKLPGLRIEDIAGDPRAVAKRVFGISSDTTSPTIAPIYVEAPAYV